MAETIKADDKSAKLIALSKAIKEKAEKAARAALTPGDYSGKFLVAVDYTLTVGDDYKKAPTTSIPLKETLALLLQHMGFTGPMAEKKLIAALEDAIAETGKGQGAIQEEYKAIVEKGMKHVQKIIDALPKVPCKGPVTGQVHFEFVEPVLDLKKVG